MRKVCKFFFLCFILTPILLLSNNLCAFDISAPKDSLIKGSVPTVYYYASDGYRYVFPNEKCYRSWFTDYSEIITIPDEELWLIPLKGNVTYRPGVRLVKIQTNPKVYAVEKGGILRWIKTEQLAEELYGDNWNQLIDDVPDAFFVNYKEGIAIEEKIQYSPGGAVSSVTTINADKSIEVSETAIQANTEVGGGGDSADAGSVYFNFGDDDDEESDDDQGGDDDDDDNDTPPTTGGGGGGGGGSSGGGGGSTPQPTCGDGNVDNGEECDDGNNTNGDGCDSTCNTEPYCGDGNVDNGEECDDGNNTNDDGCDTDCNTEPEEDTTVPVISSTTVSSITATTAVITWITDEDGTSVIDYGTASGQYTASTSGFSSASGDDFQHTVNLSGLTGTTTYYYIVKTEDASNNLATSSEHSFLTASSTPSTPTSSPPSSDWANVNMLSNGERQTFVFNGSGYGMTWAWGPIYFVKIDMNGNTQGSYTNVTAGYSFDHVGYPEIVWTGSNYGIMWPMQTNCYLGQYPGNCMYFAMLDSDGNRLTNIIVDSSGDTVGQAEKFALTWTGSEYAMAWIGSGDDIYFAKVASDGQTFTVNRTKIFSTAAGTAGPAQAVHMTWNGTNFGITWADYSDTGSKNNPTIYFARLDSSGNPLTSMVRISDIGNRNDGSMIFVEGSNYRIFWSDSSASKLYNVLVDSSGNLLSSITHINQSGSVGRPSAVKGSSNYGVTWYSSASIMFREADSSGNPLGSQENINAVGGTNDMSTIAWDGFGYSAIWQNVTDNQSYLYFASD
jgi:cysteine-rich repeat protein